MKSSGIELILTKIESGCLIAGGGWTVLWLSYTPFILYSILSAFIGCLIVFYLNAAPTKLKMKDGLISWVVGSGVGLCAFLLSPYIMCIAAAVSSICCNLYILKSPKWILSKKTSS